MAAGAQCGVGDRGRAAQPAPETEASCRGATVSKVAPARLPGSKLRALGEYNLGSQLQPCLDIQAGLQMSTPSTLSLFSPLTKSH